MSKPEVAASSAERLAYSIDEFVELAQPLTRTRVYEELKRGGLKAKKAGRRTIITAEEAKRYIASLPDYTVAA